MSQTAVKKKKLVSGVCCFKAAASVALTGVGPSLRARADVLAAAQMQACEEKQHWPWCVLNP